MAVGFGRGLGDQPQQQGWSTRAAVERSARGAELHKTRAALAGLATKAGSLIEKLKALTNSEEVLLLRMPHEMDVWVE